MTTAPEAMLPIQRAVYGRLTGDGALMGSITGVFDYVPETDVYPFVVIGEATEIPDNRHGGFGRQTVVTLHVWTKYRGLDPEVVSSVSLTDYARDDFFASPQPRRWVARFNLQF